MATPSLGAQALGIDWQTFIARTARLPTGHRTGYPRSPFRSNIRYF